MTLYFLTINLKVYFQIVSKFWVIMYPPSWCASSLRGLPTTGIWVKRVRNQSGIKLYLRSFIKWITFMNNAFLSHIIIIKY